MRTQSHRQARQRGSTLVTIMILGTISLVAAGSLLAWTSTTNKLSDRNNEYYRASAAAEAATEKVISKIAFDYRQGGEALNSANLSTYSTMVPTSAENPIMARYRFNDGQGNAGKTYVQWLPPSQYKDLSSQYKGLMGYATSFRVVSNARDTTTHWGITAGVHQEVDVTTIPLFQFAIFYDLDMEIHPGAAMTVTGPVHGNYDIYMKPGAPLTFEGDVTAAGSIITGQRLGGDCESRPSGTTITYNAAHDDTANQLNMPVGTNGTAAAVRQVVEAPPAGELPTSVMGKERFYNKADLIIELKGSGTAPTVKVKSGLINNFATQVPPAQYVQTSKAGFLDYSKTFLNKREGKTVRPIDIDVGRLKAWSENNTLLRPIIGGDVATIYVDDQRTLLATEQKGVRVLNGDELPSKGLTVVTADPIYVWGDYNYKVGNQTSSGNNTTYTRPAALIGDAITILSDKWTDASANGALSSREAHNTVVNAAFMAGIVQSANCYYSGGVENFPRFLEDWSNTKFTYNGSMVVLYESTIAKGLWLGTGSTIGIYNPPVRDWAFDQNFRNPAKLPPSTPCARTLIRGTYAQTRPDTTTTFTP